MTPRDRTPSETDARVPPTLSGMTEAEILARILPLLSGGPAALLGPGDDAAVLATPSGHVVATTDTMVRGLDWRDDWSSAQDVGHKLMVSNLADIAAMGGRPTGVLVALAAGRETPLSWVEDLARGIGAAARGAEVAVLGGDLSSAPDTVIMAAITALGEVPSGEPVRRDGAQPGDVVAVCGTLGRSGAGLAILSVKGAEQLSAAERELVDAHRRPVCPLAAGVQAATEGASAMIDISDGLLRDADRIARASGVVIDVSMAALAPDLGGIAAVIGPDRAVSAVLGGGEEHSLLATFPAYRLLPLGWRAVGSVYAVAPGSLAGVTVDGEQRERGGWDHFGNSTKPAR